MLSARCVFSAPLGLSVTAPIWQRSVPQLASVQLAVQQQIRHNSKHYDPKWKSMRRKKVVPIDLPDFEEIQESESDLDMTTMTPDKMRRRLKDAGFVPARHWQERPISLGSTGQIFEPYIPPEGDGKHSLISPSGAKQRAVRIGKRGQSYLTVRKIRNYDEDFDVDEFAEEALGIYKSAHEALCRMDEDTLHDHVTELAYPRMMLQVECKTLRWKFLQQLEPARVVHARHTHLFHKQNVFAQVTVRFHTQQLLAIYDRFGRLMYGSEVVAKDVLEYVVFEKHLANTYGKWRIHEKIVPEWMPPREPIPKTWRIEPEETDESQSEESESRVEPNLQTTPTASTATAVA